MDLVSFNRTAFPLATTALLGLLVVLPAIRHRRRTGSWPWRAVSGSTFVEGAAGWLFTAVVASFAAWSMLYGALGPDRLGASVTAPWVHALGWGAIAAAFVLAAVAQAQMGSSWRIGIDPVPTPLVTGGLFGRSRHPIYASMLLGLAGVVVISPAAATVAAWVAAALLVEWLARLEECHLLRIHGDDYLGYAARVGRFVPGVGRLPAPHGGCRPRTGADGDRPAPAAQR